jgi:hypothetical protein
MSEKAEAIVAAFDAAYGAAVGTTRFWPAWKLGDPIPAVMIQTETHCALVPMKEWNALAWAVAEYKIDTVSR